MVEAIVSPENLFDMAPPTKRKTDQGSAQAEKHRLRKKTAVTTKGEDDSEAKQNLKRLVDAVKECSPPARSLTALTVCNLCDKYRDFDHRLPCLALAATCKEAIFNEMISTFSSDLTIGRRFVETKASAGEGESLPDDGAAGEPKERILPCVGAM